MDTLNSRRPASNQLQNWLERASEMGASDLHLAVGYPPVIRQHGDLMELDGNPLGSNAVADLFRSELSEEEWKRFLQQRNLDFSLEFSSKTETWRCRVNLFFASGQVGACLRIIANRIPQLQWSGFPRQLAMRLANLNDGLVLLCGATGSGKTTTLALLIQLLMERGNCRIVTVEEPVEYCFPSSATTLITQREVGVDVQSFSDGLKYGLRQDPDVIMVGEIRDYTTAQMALSAAETGHLVLATLHTRDSKGAITRYADLFPMESQRDVRSQLALSLRSIICQRLLPGLERGDKRNLALEVLWNTSSISSSIRSGKIESIDNTIVTSRDEGMIPFDESIRVLLRAGRITRAVAEANVTDPAALNRM
jgi:twitching motility protein PilT